MAITLVASPIYLRVAATAGIASLTDFVDCMERLAMHKAPARIQAMRIVIHSAIKVNSTALGK